MGKMEGSQEERVPEVLKIQPQACESGLGALRKTDQFWQRDRQFCHVIKRRQGELDQ